MPIIPFGITATNFGQGHPRYSEATQKFIKEHDAKHWDGGQAQRDLAKNVAEGAMALATGKPRDALPNAVQAGVAAGSIGKQLVSNIGREAMIVKLERNNPNANLPEGVSYI